VGEDRPGFDEREGLMRPRDGVVRGEGSMWWLSVDDQERGGSRCRGRRPKIQKERGGDSS
jgi:hypothetical protein